MSRGLPLRAIVSILSYAPNLGFTGRDVAEPRSAFDELGAAKPERKAIVANVDDRHHDIGGADAARPLELLAQVLVERDLLAPPVVMTRGNLHDHDLVAALDAESLSSMIICERLCSCTI